MLHRDRIVALYDVHSWAGVLFSVLVFILCVSGAAAVFSGELDRWANPVLRVNPSAPVRVDADAALQVLTAAAPQRPDRPIQLALPGPQIGLYSIPAATPLERHNRIYLDPTNGRVTAPRQVYMYWYLRHLHVRLMNDWYGRVFIGLIGMAMLLSVVTGILIHQHPIRGLFRMRWRPRKGARALLADLHKWLGVWGMLFHLVIAFTGTWLGLQPLILKPPVAVAKFDGNVAAAEAALMRRPSPPAEDRGTMARLAPLVERAATDLPDLVPTYLLLENWGRANAVVTVYGNLPHTLVAEHQSFVRYAAVAGTLLEVSDVRRDTIWQQIASATKPLHYGYFGGVWVKVMYLLLGIMPAILALTGALIWFERRQRLKGPKEDAARDGIARRSVVAMLGGGWLAFLAGLIVPPVVAALGWPMGSAPMTPLFWLSWIGLAILMTFLPDTRRIAACSAAAGAVLPALGIAATLQSPFDGVSAAVAAAFAVLVAIQAWLWRRWAGRSGVAHR